MVANPHVVRMLTELAAIEPGELNRGVAIVLEQLEKVFPPSTAWMLVGRKDEDSAIGWSPVTVFNTDHSSGRRENVEVWFNERDMSASLSVRQVVAEAGTLRALRTRGRMTDEEWETSYVKADFTAMGLRDRLVGVYPVGETAEIYIGIDLLQSKAADFLEEDEVALMNIMKSLSRFCHWLALSFGVARGAHPLTRRERNILGHLLTGASEKEIASVSDLKVGSVHQVVVRVFRKLQVRSRPELMALWLESGSEDNARTERAPATYP